MDGADRPQTTIAAAEETFGKDSPSPLAQAQMRESEMISELEHIVGKLGHKLMPILSEDARKVVAGGEDRLRSPEVPRDRFGTSPTVELVEGNTRRIATLVEVVRSLDRTAEV